MNPKSNKSLCVVPWTHTFLSPQCERRLCSMSREKAQYIEQYSDTGSNSTNNFSPLSLKDHWNSEYMKDIRKRMLNGDKIEECQQCTSSPSVESTYKEHFNTELFPHLIETLTDCTSKDGHTTMNPRSFDYRISNQCNFKCRMCGDLLSSTWENETNEAGYLNSEGHLWLQEKEIKQFQEFMDRVAKPEFVQALQNKEVEEIYWVGGEPLLWDFHWDTMKMLIDKGLSENILIRYSSNLSTIEHKGMNLFRDILPHFKGYKIFASIDAAGTVGEYIRTGLNWKKWKNNLKTALNYTDPESENEIELDVTLTLPGLFGLIDLVKLSHDLNVPLNAKFVFAFDPSVVLSPLALPRTILNSLVNRLIKQLYPYINHGNKRIISRLIELKNLKTFEEQFPNSYHNAFLEGQKKLLHLEHIRKDEFKLSDIYSVNEDVLKWWNQALG